MPGTRRSGRRPLPTALHVLRGTRVRGRAHEPVPPAGRPTPPPDVLADPAALAHWNTLLERLADMHVLTRAHGEALALLSHALADHARVRAQLQQMGFQQLVVDEMKDRYGHVVRRRVRANPLQRTARDLAQQVRDLLGEFGLTPITQTKVHADAPPSRISRYITPA